MKSNIRTCANEPASTATPMEMSNHKIIPIYSFLGNLLFVAALSWLLVATSSATTLHSEGGVGKGILVRLKLPWTTLMEGESIQYEYILENLSDRSIPVAFPSAKIKFGWPIGGQPYLEGKYSTPGIEPAKLNIHNSKWPPTGLDNQGIEAWGELPAGSRIIWNQSRLPYMDFGVCATGLLETVQAHWLIGANHWISSDPVPIKAVSVSSSERKMIFEAKWSSYGWGKDSCWGTAYTIPIDGRLFLFWDNIRVTEVSPDDRFEHRIAKDSTNMEIIITGPSGLRKVYFHLRQGLTRDVPWPIGPVSLFYPKPEPIPPAELEALRKAVFPTANTPPAGGRQDKKSSPGAPSGASPAGVPVDGKGVWFWTVVSLVIFMVLMVFVLLWKLRQRTSINRDTNGNTALHGDR